MRLIAGREDHAIRETLQAAGKAAAIFIEQVGGKLVYGNGDHQFRRGTRFINLIFGICSARKYDTRGQGCN